MSSSKRDGPQLVAQNIEAIAEATNNVSHMFNSNFNTIDTMLDRFQSDLIDSQCEINRLIRDIASMLTILDHFIHGRFEEGDFEMGFSRGIAEPVRGPLESGCDMLPSSRYDATEDYIEKEHGEYLSSQEVKGLEDLQPTTDLLTKTYENLANAEKTANDRLGSFIREFTKLERSVQNGTKNWRENAFEIQKKLSKLQWFIKTKDKRSSGGAGMADDEGGQ